MKRSTSDYTMAPNPKQWETTPKNHKTASCGYCKKQLFLIKMKHFYE